MPCTPAGLRAQSLHRAQGQLEVWQPEATDPGTVEGLTAALPRSTGQASDQSRQHTPRWSWGPQSHLQSQLPLHAEGTGRGPLAVGNSGARGTAQSGSALSGPCSDPRHEPTKEGTGSRRGMSLSKRGEAQRRAEERADSSHTHLAQTARAVDPPLILQMTCLRLSSDPGVGQDTEAWLPSWGLPCIFPER